MESSVFESAGNESGEAGWAVELAGGWESVGDRVFGRKDVGEGGEEVAGGTGHDGAWVAGKGEDRVLALLTSYVGTVVRC